MRYLFLYNKGKYLLQIGDILEEILYHKIYKNQ